MDFISYKFILFFLAVMLLLLPKHKFKKPLLAVINIAFCTIGGGFIGICVIALFAVFSFFAAKVLQNKKKKAYFVASLVISLLPLLVFKYSDFLMNTVLHANLSFTSKIIVPLGISFYTLQGIGYLIDVYRGKCNAAENFLDYFIFLSLFTCVTSGPINRSESLLSQISVFNDSEFDYDRSVNGLQYVLFGLLLKILVAGRLATLVNGTYSNIGSAGGFALLTASICYTIQIYADFCGYSLMAFGLSKIIGIDVIQNFNMPYSSKSITEFWRRWHISLSSWLTEYVYFSLGGNRCSKIRSYINVLITFTISGLWHGAAWNYVAWGAINGLFIIFERITGLKNRKPGKIKDALRWIITIIMINTMWIFFRLTSISEAFEVIKKIIVSTVPSLLSLTSKAGMLALQEQLGVTFFEFCMALIAGITFIIFELVIDKRENITSIFDNKPKAIRWAMYIGISVIILVFGATGKASEFIYAQF